MSFGLLGRGVHSLQARHENVTAVPTWESKTRLVAVGFWWDFDYCEEQCFFFRAGRDKDGIENNDEKRGGERGGRW